jgi:hypothetical protein
VQIEVQVRIEAPPEVVYRFFVRLDHLRFISPRYRREWCPRLGAMIESGKEREVRIQQGDYGITIRFRTVRLDENCLIEDELISWPLHGARHIQRLEPDEGGQATRVANISTWSPPWYLKKLAERHEDQQKTFFLERTTNAKAIIEAVYKLRGLESFTDGIARDAEGAGFAPVIPLEDA